MEPAAAFDRAAGDGGSGRPGATATRAPSRSMRLDRRVVRRPRMRSCLRIECGRLRRGRRGARSRRNSGAPGSSTEAKTYLGTRPRWRRPWRSRPSLRFARIPGVPPRRAGFGDGASEVHDHVV